MTIKTEKNIFDFKKLLINKPSLEQSNFIKLLAMISMLLDHIGAFFYPLEILRIIGRISFPLFAYQIGISYDMTSSRKKYVKKLLFFGIISQIPFSFLTEKIVLNVLFSFILGILAIWSIKQKKYFYFFPIIISSFFVEYQIYGLLVILSFYFSKTKISQTILFSLTTFLYSFYFLNKILIQLYSLMALPIIFNPFLKINLPKNLFYIFYPSHLIIIYLIKTFIL